MKVILCQCKTGGPGCYEMRAGLEWLLSRQSGVKPALPAAGKLQQAGRAFRQAGRPHSKRAAGRMPALRHAWCRSERLPTRGWAVWRQADRQGCRAKVRGATYNSPAGCRRYDMLGAEAGACLLAGGPSCARPIAEDAALKSAALRTIRRQVPFGCAQAGASEGRAGSGQGGETRHDAVLEARRDAQIWRDKPASYAAAGFRLWRGCRRG